jgi:hypothetical protein
VSWDPGVFFCSAHLSLCCSFAMSSFCVVFLLSVLTLPWPAFGAACQPRALQLPYNYNRLVTQVETRGVLWQIGGPTPQNITLMPSASVLSTFLTGTVELTTDLDGTMIHMCGVQALPAGGVQPDIVQSGVRHTAADCTTHQIRRPKPKAPIWWHISMMTPSQTGQRTTSDCRTTPVYLSTNLGFARIASTHSYKRARLVLEVHRAF